MMMMMMTTTIMMMMMMMMMMTMMIIITSKGRLYYQFINPRFCTVCKLNAVKCTSKNHAINE